MTFLHAIQSQRSHNSSPATDARPLRLQETSTDRASIHLQPYENIEVSFDPEIATYWCHMRPPVKPIVTNGLLDDLRHMQDALEKSLEPNPHPLSYFVFASKAQGVFSLGGDLQYFADSVRSGNRESILRYAHKCVEVVYRNHNAFGLPIITMALVQGDALGGGFETALSFDMIIAEKSAKMGLPEILFNLFPGMGAYSFLSRRMDAIRAEKMIMSGKIYSAEELHDLGLVDVVAEDGHGEATVYDYIQRNSHRRNAHLATFKTRRRVNPISFEELKDVVEIWVDAVFQLDEADLTRMARLVTAQNRRFGRAPSQKAAISA
jgi:DSF synthase